MSLESDASPPELTPMQLECLRRAASTDKEIARELSISPDTVSNHIRNAMRRLQAGDRRTAMARLAVHPLYADIVIPGVVISARKEPPSWSEPRTSPAQLSVLGVELAPLPGRLGRLWWIVGVFVGLALMTIIGVALLNTAGDLISVYAPSERP